MASGLPVTCEETLIIRKQSQVPSTEVAELRDLEEFVRDFGKYSEEFHKMKRKMYENLQLPAEPCYITSHLYDKSGKLVHVVGKGEFSGLDENGKKMLLYDKHGLPKNADGSVRKFSLAEVLEIQKKQNEELPSYLPRKPKMIKRKMAKKRKNPPPKKMFDDFDEVVAAETERLRKINERL